MRQKRKSTRKPAQPTRAGQGRTAPDTDTPTDAPEKDTRGEQARAPRGLRRRGIYAEHRRFLLLVVVPAVLMLGSVFTHTVATDLQARVSELEAQNSRTGVERETLDVRVAELSSPDRIRELARRDLHMRDPDGKDIRVLDVNGEDVSLHGGEQATEAAATR